MAQNGRKRPDQRNKRRKAEDQPPTPTPFDRLMERAAQPGLLTYALAFAIIVAVWRWPRAVVEPTSVAGTVGHVLDGTIATVVFLGAATLTTFAYCLLFAGPSETNNKFIAAVLNRAGIGAGLGALAGLRVMPVLLASPDDASTARATFPDMMGNVGNIITMFTFLFIATTAFYSLGPLIEAVAATAQRFRPLRRFSDGLFFRRIAPLLLVTAINLLAGRLAWVVYAELRRL